MKNENLTLFSDSKDFEREEFMLALRNAFLDFTQLRGISLENYNLWYKIRTQSFFLEEGERFLIHPDMIVDLHGHHLSIWYGTKTSYYYDHKFVFELKKGIQVGTVLQKFLELNPNCAKDLMVLLTKFCVDELNLEGNHSTDE